MAIIECPDCGANVSTSAQVCPGCGREAQPASRGQFARAAHGLAHRALKLLFYIFNALMAIVSTYYLVDVGRAVSEAADATAGGMLLGAVSGFGLGLGLLFSVWVAGCVVLGMLALVSRPGTVR